MALVLDKVSKSFAGIGSYTDITHALGEVDLRVEDGEFISIVGPSGCGKSTILRLIAGLISPTTGTITLNGKVVEGTDSNRGMAFQKSVLFPWLNVEKNISFGPRMRKDTANLKERVDKMLEMSGLTDFRTAFPHQLSGGMTQRVSLARTMINEPEVFLLDEPLGALDAFTRMKLQDELLNMWQRNKNIMVMVTHDVDEAIYMGNRVIVMTSHPGRIVKDIHIDLEYPRNRLDDRFLSYRSQILEMLDFGQRQ